MGTFRNEGMPEARTTERRRYRRRTRRDAPLSQKKSNKLWIWKAYCRDTGQLVDWECGDRDQNTLTRLLDRLKTWKVVLYCTDAYAPYDHALPVGRHFQGKEQTWRLEQNNGRQRYWEGVNERSIRVTAIQKGEGSHQVFHSHESERTWRPCPQPSSKTWRPRWSVVGSGDTNAVAGHYFARIARFLLCLGNDGPQEEPHHKRRNHRVTAHPPEDNLLREKGFCLHAGLTTRG